MEESSTQGQGGSVCSTRSATEQLTTSHCFFCQKDSDQSMFTLRTENAGKERRRAVQLSQDPALMTRLNGAISPSDAHAIDVRYHKVCWTRHVFHVLRDDACNQAKSTKNDLPMQIPCLIELINLIDFQTHNKAYLPMDVLERTYIAMLGGSDKAKKHTSTLTRKWLKEKILSELPTLKSVRQKGRGTPSILYSPDACEEDMVNTSMLKMSIMIWRTR